MHRIEDWKIEENQGKKKEIRCLLPCV